MQPDQIQPSPETTTQPQPVTRQILPLSKEDLALWRGNIDKARAVRETVMGWAEANLEKYAPELGDDPDGYGEELNSNRDFTLVERKKADLFYQRPEVSAVPSPLMEGHEDLLDTHTAILNAKLGLNGVHAKALVHQVLFDVLCTSGTGWTAMGYESATVPTPTTHPQTGQPMMAPVALYEDCFWRWFSPKQALAPHDAHTVRFDDWAWIGMEFEIPVRVAKRKGWVKEDYKGGPSSQDLYFDHGISQGGGDTVARGVLIYYKSALYRDDRVHPLHQTQLVLMDDVDDPAEHKDSPYQTLDEQGRLTPDSLIGFPIHPMTIRTLTDSAHVPSDCTISRPLVNELNKFRGQMIEQREANIMRWSYNTDTLPTDALSKIVRSPIGGFIGLPGEAFSGEGAIKELPHGTFPRENFQFNDYLDNDLARTHALDANQSGAGSEHARTATEASIAQTNVNARLGLERDNNLDWYILGVTKFSTLIQRFLTLEQAAAIVGQERAAAWDQWRKVIPASLAFTALPDSAIKNDLAQERKRAMDEYTFFANDPFINRAELLKQLMPRLHYNSAKIINPKPPEKGPEPAKPSFAFKGEDLNPLAPQFAIVLEILKQTGLTISPEAVQEAQGAAMNAMMAAQQPSAATGQGAQGPNTEHGGMVAPMESLSKHATALTGGRQGIGQTAEMGGAGGVQ